MGLDVGPKTVATFQAALEPCKTIVRQASLGEGGRGRGSSMMAIFCVNLVLVRLVCL